MQRKQEDEAEPGSVGRQERNGVLKAVGEPADVCVWYRCADQQDLLQVSSPGDGVLWGEGGRLGLCLCPKEKGMGRRNRWLRDSDAW